MNKGSEKKANAKQGSSWSSRALALFFALVLLAIGAVFAIPMFSSQMSVAVSLTPSSCSDVHGKQEQGFQHNALPCHFNAFLFPSKGGWVAVGKGGVMAAQCVLIPYADLNARATRTKHFLAGTMKLAGLKKACRGSYAVYHPTMRKGGWHQFWSWDRLASMVHKEMK